MHYGFFYHVLGRGTLQIAMAWRLQMQCRDCELREDFPKTWFLAGYPHYGRVMEDPDVITPYGMST